MLVASAVMIQPSDPADVPRAIYLNFSHDGALAAPKSTGLSGGLQGIQGSRIAA